MRERIRQTYTSLEIGLMQEENEQLKRRLEKAIENIEDYINQFKGIYPNVDNRYFDLYKHLRILKGEEEII